jgi:oligosaccharide reducing-end xylanase
MNSTSAISATDPDRLAFVRDLWHTAVPSGKARYYDGMLYFLGLLYDSGTLRMWMGHGSCAHGAGGPGSRCTRSTG